MVFVITCFIIREAYMIISHDGNLSLLVRNQSNIEEVDIKVYIDNEIVFFEDVGNEFILDYTGKSLLKSPGRYKVRIEASDRKIQYEDTFYIVGSKWLDIQFLNKERDGFEYIIKLSVSSFPFVIE